MNIKITEGFSEDLTTLVIPMLKQKSLKPWLSTLSNLLNIPEELLISDFKANHKEIFTTYWNGQRVILLGIGEDIKQEKIIEAFRSLSHKTKGKHFTKIGVDFINFQFEDIDKDLLPLFTEMAANGLVLGQYDIQLLKSKTTDNGKIEYVEFLAFDYDDSIKDKIHKGVETAKTQCEIMTLLNLPASHKTSLVLADWAKKSGDKYGYSVRVFEKEEIEKLGFHALLAVNRGSEIPPRFIVMEYKSKRFKSMKTIGLVGKGVTYDTGGLSIKTQGMHFMKSDMGGAAAVLGTVEIAAKLELPFDIIGIIPTTDNCVDAKSIKPGDVIDSYSGLTIEVMDTDAEGRLILADGLNYLVKNYNPDILIDLATLTGSSVRTLSYYAGAMFTQNDELANEMYLSGQRSGERVWRLPMWDEYKVNLKSDIADVRNYGLRPLAGASEAAKFLEHFVENHPAYVHLDIAGVAYKDTEYAKHKVATAYGVRLLMDYLFQLEIKQD
ncbi:MAG: M17 family metallopeptidase [Saprospiraceae bacterium]